MVIDYSTKNNFHLVGTETIPAGYWVGITNPDQQTCRRMSVVLPKTGLGKAGDDFGLMEIATLQHNNCNGGGVHLERSVNSSKSFKSNSTSPIRHSEFSEIRSEFSMNDSRYSYPIFSTYILDLGGYKHSLATDVLALAYLKPVLSGDESGLSFAELEISSAKPGSSSANLLLAEDKPGLADDNFDLVEDRLGLAAYKMSLRHHSFTGMDCLSVHWKNFILHVQDINTTRFGFKLNIWNGTAH